MFISLRYSLPIALMFFLLAMPLQARDIEEADETFNLGRQAFENGNYSKAMEYFNKTLELDYKQTEAYYWLGYSYQKLEYFDEAIKNYKEAINFCPEMTQLSYIRLGQCEELTGSSSGFTHYKYGVSFIPGYEDILEKDAFFRLTLGKVTQEKIDAYEELLQFHPFDPLIVKSLVIAYELKGKHKKGSELLKTVLKEKKIF